MRVGATVTVHAIVDFFSFVGISLLPLLQTRLTLSDVQVATLLGLGSVTSGLIQPAVAWISDRFDTRVVGTLGLLVAAVCVSSLGYAQNFWQLLLLHSLGAAGVGAFHPPAAAAVGQLSGTKRSIGIAVFFLFGMIGGMLGNVMAPQLVGWLAALRPDDAGAPDAGFGLRSLVWLIPLGLVAAAALGRSIHRIPHRDHAAHDDHRALSREDRRARWGAVWVLYAANVIRFNVNMALVYLFAKWAAAHTLVSNDASEMTDALGVKASQLNGPLQAGMQAGMGAVGLAFGFVLAARHEKAAFVVVPVLGAGAIAAFAMLTPGDVSAPTLAIALAAFSGVGFGSLIPVSMTAAQRLLPHRTGLASGLMLGGAWAFAFVGPRAAEMVHHALGLDAAFYATAAGLVLAGVLALFVPGRLLANHTGK